MHSVGIPQLATEWTKWDDSAVLCVESGKAESSAIKFLNGEGNDSE
jgi:hypothetical protein